MENENMLPEAQPAGGVTAPESGEKDAGAQVLQLIALVLSYVLAHFYMKPDWEHWFLVIPVLFLVMTELVNIGRKALPESRYFMACMLVFSLGLTFRGAVFEEEGGFFAVLALHGLAIWCALCRSGTLLEGRTCHLAPADAFLAVIFYPFKHFGLRILTIVRTVRDLFAGKKKPRAATVAAVVLALLAGLLLLALAASLLSSADDSFAFWADKVRDFLRIDLDDIFSEEFRILFLPRLLVGAYIFGLVGGTAREDTEKVRKMGDQVNSALGKLAAVPWGLWAAMGTVFALVYGFFFFFQGSYLFGAFTRTLPEGFIVSRYARQGFFELCGVMAVNFALTWAMVRSSRAVTSAVKAVTLVLLAESLLFAVVAGSKLWLYIDCFGFTPLRLLSSWLVLVLAAGTVAYGVNIMTGRQTFRPWAYGSVGALVLLSLI